MTTEKRRVWWGDFPTTDYAAIDPEATIAVLPVAAIEQHGPHLPVSTDTTIMNGMLETVIARLPDDLDIRILPVQAVGKSNEHLHAPGTLTLPATTLIEAWTELGASVARAGVKKIVVVNSHGGNEEIMGIVDARTARALQHAGGEDELVALRPAGRAVSATLEDRYGIHGGDFETSLMLHFRPDLVDMTKAEDFASSVAARRAGIRAAAPDRNARLRLDRHRPQPARRGRRGFARHGRERPADGRASGGRVHPAAEGCQEGKAGRLV